MHACLVLRSWLVRLCLCVGSEPQGFFLAERIKGNKSEKLGEKVVHIFFFSLIGFLRRILKKKWRLLSFLARRVFFHGTFLGVSGFFFVHSKWWIWRLCHSSFIHHSLTWELHVWKKSLLFCHILELEIVIYCGFRLIKLDPFIRWVLKSLLFNVYRINGSWKL